MKLESRSSSYVESTVQDGFWIVHYKVRMYYMYVEWLIALGIIWFLYRRRKDK